MIGIVQEAKDASTMNKVWAILLWSFAALLKGVWSSADWEGKVFDQSYCPGRAKKASLPLCNGY
eukprot:2597931-Lingulodinium_polyedra.AAC.1